MVTETVKLKNGTITLPEQLQRIWKENDVLIRGDRKRIIIERPRLKGRIFSKETEQKLRALGKKISEKDIEAAIKWARGKSK